jgi:hypothetical protein
MDMIEFKHGLNGSPMEVNKVSMDAIQSQQGLISHA